MNLRQQKRRHDAIFRDRWPRKRATLRRLEKKMQRAVMRGFRALMASLYAMEPQLRYSQESLLRVQASACDFCARVELPRPLNVVSIDVKVDL